jgi:hypothetical protein
VAVELASAPGSPQTFHPTSPIIMSHREDVGEVLVGHPAMRRDDKRTHIWQYGWKATKANRRQQRKLRGQGHGRAGRRHRAPAGDSAATAILAGARTNSTASSGNLLNASKTRARAAKMIAAGRRR